MSVSVPLTNNTSSFLVECYTGSQWTPGAAFFTLVALSFGCIAHPRGSLAFNNSERVWRLSPLFMLVESVAIVWAVIQGWRAGYSRRVICTAILTVRLGNTTTGLEYAELKYITLPSKAELTHINETAQIIQPQGNADAIVGDNHGTTQRTMDNHGALPEGNVAEADIGSIPLATLGVTTTSGVDERYPSAIQRFGNPKTAENNLSNARQQSQIPNETEEDELDHMEPSDSLTTLRRLKSYKHKSESRESDVWIAVISGKVRGLSQTLKNAIKDDFSRKLDKKQKIAEFERSNLPPPEGDSNGHVKQFRELLAYKRAGEAQELAVQDVIFDQHLTELEALSHQLSSRIFVWIPMLLQVIKLGIVSGGWVIWGPKVGGFMYFTGWLLTESLFIFAEGELSVHERNQVRKLSDCWQKDIECLIRLKNQSWYTLDDNKHTFLNFGWRASYFQAILNTSVPIYLIAPSVWSRLGTMSGWLPNLTSWPIWIEMPVLQAIITVLYGTYISLVWLVVSTIWTINTANSRMYPGYIAVIGIGISLLRYTGKLNDYARYDCLATSVPWWYDWLG